MERDDKRARRPPARKTEPEGLEKTGEPILGTDGKDLDLRAGQQRQELGRNPHGGPVSVNEMLTRYKEAQARKFAEHGANNRQDAPADVRTDTSRQQDFTDAVEQPLARSADDIPIIRQTPEPQAVPQHGERSVFSFMEDDAGTGSTHGSARLRFNNAQRADDVSTLSIAEKTSGSSAILEQPPPRDFRTEPTPSFRSSFSHEHAPRSTQERQGFLQHSRVQTPDNPINTPHKRNTQRDSEKFIQTGEAKPEHAGEPIRDYTVPADARAEGFHRQNASETVGQPLTKNTNDIPIIRFTPEEQAGHVNLEQPVASSANGAQTRNSGDSAARLRFGEQPSGGAETPLPDYKAAAPVADSGRSPDSPVTPGQPQNPLPDGSRPERNTLSHTRPPRSKQNREARLQHNRGRLPDIPKDARRKNNTQRDAARFMLPEGVKQETAAAPAVAGTLVKPPFVRDISPHAADDTERVQTVGKLKFTDGEITTPAVADAAADTHIDADTAIEKEQTQDSPSSGDMEEQPPSVDDVPETKTPPRDSPLSHTRESAMTHERQGRLLHAIAPIAETAVLRHKHQKHDTQTHSPEVINPLSQDSSADTARTAADATIDWRRVDDSPGSPADAPPQNDADAPADTEASRHAPDVKRTPTVNFFADSGLASGEDTVAPADTDNPAVESTDGGHETPTPAPESGSTAAPAPDSTAPADSASTPKPESGSDSSGGDHKKKDSKLKFEDAADTPEGKKSGRKLDKALGKAERSSEKLTKARENLPKKRRLRMNREFDAEKGKLKPRLRFEEEVKTRSERLKGSPVTRPIKLGASAAVGYAHKKIYQVENENVAVKAAHRGEMLAEHGIRSAYRFAKTAPYRKVQKLERRTAKLNIKAAYRQALHENPELAKKPLARMMQKRRIKKQYAKAARDAKRAGSKTAAVMKRTGEAAKKAAAAVKKAVSNPKVLIVVGLLFLIIILLFGVISSCSSMASGIGSSVTAMSYTAADSDVDAAELYYTELETDLQILIANTETDRAGYDEYRYYIDGIGHDPYTLMAFLSAVYHDFAFADIQSVLDGIFAEQYRLEFTPSVEIRTRTETRTGYYTGADGIVYSYTYEVEVEYNWYILTVTLTSQPLPSVISPRMDSDQSQHYALLMQSKGFRQYAASPFPFNWLPNVSSYYGYRVHPITGVKDYHLGIDIALPAGTEILAAQNGTVTFAGDLGGYGNVVVIEDGDGLVTKYAHCDTLLVSAGQAVTAGDTIATVGSTGDSTGPHLHFEVLKGGVYLNPIYFSLTSSY